MPSQPNLPLINSAFAIFGQDPIQSIDAETPGAQAAGLIYRLVIDDLLGFYPWSFSKETRQLQRLATIPDTGFSYAYLLPPDANGLPIQISDANDFRGDFQKYSLHGMEIHADAEELWAIIKVSALPELWSPTFRYAATLALAGNFALSVTGDRNLKESLLEDAFGPPQMMRRGGAMGLAIQENALNQPSPVLAVDGGPLIAARTDGLYSDW